MFGIALWDARHQKLLLNDLASLVAQGRDVKAHLADCRWLDIGRHDDYALAIETFEALRSEFLPDEGGEQSKS